MVGEALKRIQNSFLGNVRAKRNMKKYLFSRRVVWLVLILSAAVFLSHSIACAKDKQVRIGILAIRGASEAAERWTPTAEYLSVQIPEYRFVIVPLDFEELYAAVENGEVDFVLANSGIYVELEYKYGIDRIVTLQDLWQGQAYDQYGGVIFTSKNRRDITSSDDLIDKSFMAVHETSFGGWKMAQREFKSYGIDPYRDFTDMQFGGTHDEVVYAVQNGRADAGTVRTGILEKMDEEGKIDIKDFTVLNQQEPDNFPLLVSTRLYSEWPLARVKHTSDQLSQQVTIALLSMPSDGPAALNADIAGWTIPHNYQPVHDCLRELRVSPYEDIGKITLTDILQQYWSWVLAGFIGVIGLVAVTIHINGLNRKLNVSTIALKESRNKLEQRVNERTSELKESNRQLIKENKNRQKAEEKLRESEKRYRNIYKRVDDVIYETDFNGCLIGISPSIEKHSGYCPEELIGQNVADFYACPDEYTALWSDMEVEGTVNDFEISMKKKDGELIIVSVTAHIVFDEDGQPVKTEGVLRDITERKRNEAKLKQNENMLRQILDTSPNCIFVKDWNGMYLVVNKRIAELHSTTPEEIVGKYDYEIAQKWFETIDYNEFRKAEQAVIDNKKTLFIAEEPFVYHDGTERWFQTTKIPFELENNQNCLLVISTDITKRKQAEESLQRYSRQLETLNTTTAALSTSLELDNVLELILDQIGQVIPLDSGAIFLREEDKLRVVLDQGNTPSVKGQIVSVENELFKEIQQTGEPLILNNVKTDPRFQNWGQSENIADWMGLPLIARETLIGILTLDSNHPGAYSPEQANLVQSFASQAAQAIENARLCSESRRRLKHMQALRNIDIAITSSMDLSTSLNVLLDNVTVQLAVDAAIVLLVNVQSQTMRFIVGRGFRTNALQHTQLSVGESLAGQAALEQRLIHVPDLNQTETSLLRLPSFRNEGFVTYFGIPLVAKGQVNGVLEIFHRTPLSPNQEWFDFLEMFASQAAIAIDNARLFDNLHRSNAELFLAYDATLEGWARALELRDQETEGHSRRVTEITERLARIMGINDEDLIHIRRGAILHDIGKMGVPDAILLKTGQLTDEEWVIMKKHPVYAFEMLAPITFLKPALDIPHYHHERWDGGGYLYGLKGEQIPLAARIFSVVDVWDALRSDRPYQKAWSNEDALAYIQEQSGKHFDPQVVDKFLHYRKQQNLAGRAE